MLEFVISYIDSTTSPIIHFIGNFMHVPRTGVERGLSVSLHLGLIICNIKKRNCYFISKKKKNIFKIQHSLLKIIDIPVADILNYTLHRLLYLKIKQMKFNLNCSLRFLQRKYACLSVLRQNGS